MIVMTGKHWLMLLLVAGASAAATREATIRSTDPDTVAVQPVVPAAVPVVLCRCAGEIDAAVIELRHVARNEHDDLMAHHAQILLAIDSLGAHMRAERSMREGEARALLRPVQTAVETAPTPTIGNVTEQPPRPRYRIKTWMGIPYKVEEVERDGDE